MQYVVAVDGSNPGREALEHALTLAQRLDASVTVVYSVEQRVVAEDGDEMYQEHPDEAEARGEEILAAAESQAQEAGVAVETALLWGDPTETIPAFAEELEADGIVVGHRGLSERIEGMVGSVAKRIVQRATVPVTVVR